jgi:hypothetical protein
MSKISSPYNESQPYKHQLTCVALSPAEKMEWSRAVKASSDQLACVDSEKTLGEIRERDQDQIGETHCLRKNSLTVD